MVRKPAMLLHSVDYRHPLWSQSCSTNNGPYDVSIDSHIRKIDKAMEVMELKTKEFILGLRNSPFPVVVWNIEIMLLTVCKDSGAYCQRGKILNDETIALPKDVLRLFSTFNKWIGDFLSRHGAVSELLHGVATTKVNLVQEESIWK